MKELADAGLVAALIAFLRTRRMLLVLDNCEHLLDASATLADHTVAFLSEPDDAGHQS